MRIGGATVEADTTRSTFSHVNRSRARLVLYVEHSAVGGEKADDLVKSLERCAVQCCLAAVVARVDVCSRRHAQTDRLDGLALGLVAADGVFFFGADAGSGHE